MEPLDFQRVIEQGRQLQACCADLDAVAVGGTAAALHCAHRFSLDVDAVTPHLRARFDEVAARLEAWPGWRTNRLNPHSEVECRMTRANRMTNRRRRRLGSVPNLSPHLTRNLAGFGLRSSSFVIRHSTAEFGLNLLYPARTSQSWAGRFAEACEGTPTDLALVPLTAYKGLGPPLNDWPFVAECCRRLGRILLKQELAGLLPVRLPDDWPGT